MIPKPLGIRSGHAPGSLAEFLLRTRSPRRLKQILSGIKRINMVKIGVDQNEVTIRVVNAICFRFVKYTDFRSQEISARVAGSVNRYALGQEGILLPQLQIILSPGEQVR